MSGTTTTIGTKKSKSTNDGFFTSQICSLLTVPLVSLMLVAALDNADKHLLGSSFPMLEKTLHLDVKTLGYFSLFSNLSYSLGMPIWGWAVHTYGIENIHNLLSGACMLWGLSTIGIAQSGASYISHATFRCINGVALASILPLSQTILVELVAVSVRGRAFGLMSVCEKVAGTLASASIIYFDNWQYPYYVLGIFSVLMAGVVRKQLNIRGQYQNLESSAINDKNNEEMPKMTLLQIIQRIVKIPAFICLVAQGVFGGTPWDMMSFVLLLLDWRGFSKEQIVSMQFSVGISGTIGSCLGGALGDYFAIRHPTKGRIYVALFGVLLHIPTFGMFIYAPDYLSAFIWYNIFYLTATWTPAAAIKPICAELAQNTSERAQIVSLWVLIEKTASAIFGAPLVGYLTNDMIAEAASGKEDSAIASATKAQSLALSLISLASLFWGLSGACWLTMAFTLNLPTTEVIKQEDSSVGKDDEDEELARMKHH